MTLELSDIEYKFFMEMLDILGDYYSNAGCNDYVIKLTPENIEFIRMLLQQEAEEEEEIEEFEKAVSEGKEFYYTFDFLILNYFENKFKNGRI